MRVAILGGTFNPPHFGHLFFANEVRQQLNYDKIVFVPTSISAHKLDKTIIDSSHRMKMLEISLSNVSWAEVSDCDIRRGGVTRTIDTISDIKKEYNLSEKPGFIIGDDLAKDFHKWKNPELISRESNIILGCRDLESIDFQFEHKKVKNRVFPLSSSEIRDRVINNIDIDFLLPIEVIEYIKSYGLYKNNK